MKIKESKKSACLLISGKKDMFPFPLNVPLPREGEYLVDPYNAYGKDVVVTGIHYLISVTQWHVSIHTKQID